MKKILSLIVVPALFACNNTSTTSVDTSDSQQVEAKTEQPGNSHQKPGADISKPGNEDTPVADFTGCYRSAVKRDTILLQIQQTGHAVSGTLKFDNYQKDSSSGTVKGDAKGDTLVVWYDFNSEGMHSVMEIVYKKTAGGLVRAVGEFESKADTAKFKDHSNLKFDPAQSLTKVECAE